MASIGAAQPSATAAKRAEAAPADDPYTWLEEIQGERALDWARHENARTLGELQADPRYQQFYDRALEILQARDRIPAVSFRPDGLYNFWQDADHVRGIVRRTSWPATAPTLPPGRRCSTSTRSPRPRARTGSIRA